MSLLSGTLRELAGFTEALRAQARRAGGKR